MANTPLWREDAARLLPAPSADLYASADPPSPSWKSLLAFADPTDVRAWRRVTGWRGLQGSKVRHLLHVHRLAFESELAGSMRKADFFWTESILLLKGLWPKTSHWDDAAKALAVPALGSGTELRNAIAIDLMLDSHLAFANGCAASQTASDRAMVHADFITRLLALQNPPIADPATVLVPLLQMRARKLAQAHRSEDAMAALRAVPASVASLVSEQLAELALQSTLAKLHAEPDGHELDDARLLAQGIAELEIQLALDPDALVLYDTLSHLHHMRSVRLANGGDMPTALVASAKAAAYDPANKRADDTMEQLTSAMSRLIEEMERVRAELKINPGSQLNAEGQALQRQARLGFKLLKTFQATGEAADITAARTAATGLAVWRELTEGASAARPSNDALRGLLDALILLMQGDAEDAEGIAFAFREMQESRPQLPPLDASRVAQFVLGRRLGQEAGEGSSEATPEDTTKSKNRAQGHRAGGHTAKSPAADPATHVSLLTIAPAAPAPSREPLSYWLAGSQNGGSRAFVTVAAVCVVGVAALSAVEMPRRQVRDDAVAVLRTARSGLDSDKAIAAAERFLSASPISSSDPRHDEVLDGYSRAFTTWFAALDNPASDAARRRIATFQSLIAR